MKTCYLVLSSAVLIFLCTLIIGYAFAKDNFLLGVLGVIIFLIGTLIIDNISRIGKR